MNHVAQNSRPEEELRSCPDDRAELDIARIESTRELVFDAEHR